MYDINCRCDIVLKIFRGLEVRTNVRLMLWRPNDSIKGKCDFFSGYKQTSKLSLLCLECKLQQDRYGWCIYNLKCQKTLDRTHLETSKQQTRHRWCFQILKCLRKCNNGVFGGCKQTSKVHCMYLVIKKLKVNYQWYFWMVKCNKPYTRDIFREKNAWIKVCLTYLKVWKLGKRYDWCFWRTSDSMKDKSDTLSGHKQASKVCLVYLEVKQHYDRCGWCIYNLKKHKMVELRHSETSKQQARSRWSCKMLKCLNKWNNAVFRSCKPTSKLQHIYLAFKNLKINCK